MGANMFTSIAFLLTLAIAWFTGRMNERDRREYDRHPDDQWLLLLHSRQDLKLIAFSLFGVIVMLGVIADRIG